MTTFPNFEKSARDSDFIRKKNAKKTGGPSLRPGARASVAVGVVRRILGGDPRCNVTRAAFIWPTFARSGSSPR